MKKLRILLKSRYFIYILIILSLLRICSIINKKSKIDINNTNFTCVVTNINGNKYLLNCGELLEISIEDNSIKIGDILRINGELSFYNNNTNFNLFDYKDYQENRNIFYYLNINSYQRINASNNIILKIKRFIYDRIYNLKSFDYLNAFILGNKSGIDTTLLKKIGIIHLFAVSGMHITLLLSLIDKYTNNGRTKKYITIIFLLFYYLIIKSVSLLRCIVFYVFKSINKNINLGFNKYFEIIISILLIIIIKPNAIYDIGFYYSVILSSGISILNTKIKVKNKIIKRLIISLFIFLLSFPLNIYTSFEINILSIVYNLIFIPFVSVIVFPLSLLTFIFPFLDNILIIIITFFELLINLLSKINISFVFMKPSIYLLVLYYFLIFVIIFNYKYIYIFIFVLLLHYNYNFLFRSIYIISFDVGQGDSTLIHINDNNILIDTGGVINKYISDNITIPVLKSFGIRKLNYLVTTHGDFDHMGEAINLVNNFKVEKVIFNCGEFNDLEKELIKVLDKKHIQYYSCIKELNIDKNKLYFLQTKDHDNENDNSNVIYTELNGYKFMFMGDASITTEKEILDKYNLSDIDVLKVGHHGSKTSSSKEFIDEIEPKYSVISVGKNNRYGHPNKEVLDNLKDTKIYRTDVNGSIMIKINKNKLKVETCSP